MNTFFFMLVCLVIIGAFSAFIVNRAAAYNSLRTEHARLQSQLDTARARYHALNYQIIHIDSDAYIERLARERFGWARANEIVFRQRTE